MTSTSSYQCRSLHGMTLPPQEISNIVANTLLDIDAVAITGPKDEPFKLTSGAQSPVYVDIRKLISFPQERQRLLDFARKIVEQNDLWSSIDVIAGGETAGIAFAAWLAQMTEKPMIYIRKNNKKFGRQNLIEGHLPSASRVLLVEDMTTDGGSKIHFVDTLRKTGASCTGCLVMFAYGIPEAIENFRALGVNPYALCSWEDVLTAGISTDRFDESTCKKVRDYIALRGKNIRAMNIAHAT